MCGLICRVLCEAVQGIRVADGSVMCCGSLKLWCSGALYIEWLELCGDVTVRLRKRCSLPVRHLIRGSATVSLFALLIPISIILSGSDDI